VRLAFVAVPAEGIGEHREGTYQPVALRQRHRPAGESLLGKTGVGRKHSMTALWVASIASGHVARADVGRPLQGCRPHLTALPTCTNRPGSVLDVAIGAGHAW
jgi:hypothetical protein